MKRLHVAFLCCTLLLIVCALPAVASHWGYSGEFSPEMWDKADPGFALCGSGKNQSPINIEPQYKTNLPPIQFAYTQKGQTIVNNGHTIEVQFPSENTMIVGNQTFTLVQAHFHSPSENKLNGRSFPLEAHFVHRDTVGNLAVLAVFFEEGAENPNIATLWNAMPQNAGDSAALPVDGFDGLSLYPDTLEYFFFNGSLTTPPCSEGVRWFVFKNPRTVSGMQIEQFTSVIGANNRPVQPVNARPVLE
jgi:carbonic anhydrase